MEGSIWCTRQLRWKKLRCLRGNQGGEPDLSLQFLVLPRHLPDIQTTTLKFATMRIREEYSYQKQGVQYKPQLEGGSYNADRSLSRNTRISIMEYFSLFPSCAHPRFRFSFHASSRSLYLGQSRRVTTWTRITGGIAIRWKKLVTFLGFFPFLRCRRPCTRSIRISLFSAMLGRRRSRQSGSIVAFVGHSIRRWTVTRTTCFLLRCKLRCGCHRTLWILACHLLGRTTRADPYHILCSALLHAILWNGFEDLFRWREPRRIL